MIRMLRTGLEATRFALSIVQEARRLMYARCYVVAENKGKGRLQGRKFKRDEARHRQLTGRQGENRTGPWGQTRLAEAAARSKTDQL